MNWHLLNPFNEDFGSHPPIRMQRAERLILAYWGIALLLGIPLLFDWLTTWAVPQTWSNPWLLGLLLGTLLLSQVLYIMVSHAEGRPIHWGAALLFAVCNGIAETLTFALVFRAGLVIGAFLTGLVLPAWASYGGLALGLIFFVIYGGAIHGLFWIRLLPPHFHDDPLSLRIRKLRPFSETLLVLGWSLTWWLYGDIWTVVFCHTIIDLTLMLQVRPPLFQRKPGPQPVADAEPEPLPLTRQPVTVSFELVADNGQQPDNGMPRMPHVPHRVYGLNGLVSDNTLRTWTVTTGAIGYGAMRLLDYVADQAARDMHSQLSSPGEHVPSAGRQPTIDGR